MRSSFVMNRECCQIRGAFVKHHGRRRRRGARESPGAKVGATNPRARRLIAGVAYAVWRAISSRVGAGPVGWEPQPFPFPPQPAVDTTSPWVDAADTAPVRPTIR